MKRKLALFGIGRWGKNLSRNFYDLEVLKIICEPSKKAIDENKSQFEGVYFTSNEEDVFDNKNIDKVVIATPAASHKALIIKSLKAKKDVFVEKPLCLTLEEGKEIYEVLKNSKNILMVGHLLHYHPCIEKIKKMIKENYIGKILSIHSNRLNLGTIRNEEDVFWSFAPHDISIILSLIDEKLDKLSVFSENILDPNNPDIFNCHLQFQSNIKATIKTSWLNPYKEQKFSIIGTDGMILFDDLAPWEEKIKYYKDHIVKKNNSFMANKSNLEFIRVDQYEPLKKECIHFLDCCSQRKKPLTDFNEGIKVIELLNRISQIQKTSNNNSKSNYFCHASSVIGETAIIGEGTKIWHYCHIMDGAQVGSNSNIGQNVFIQKGASIGNRVKIQNNVSVYDGVVCEDDVFLGPSVVFTNIKMPRSEFPNDNYLKTIVKKGATIGANATIVCGITIGEYAFIGAGSVVTKDVEPYSMVFGNPAKHKAWVNRKGKKSTS